MPSFVSNKFLVFRKNLRTQVESLPETQCPTTLLIVGPFTVAEAKASDEKRSQPPSRELNALYGTSPTSPPRLGIHMMSLTPQSAILDACYLPGTLVYSCGAVRVRLYFPYFLSSGGLVKTTPKLTTLSLRSELVSFYVSLTRRSRCNTPEPAAAAVPRARELVDPPT